MRNAIRTAATLAAVLGLGAIGYAAARQEGLGYVDTPPIPNSTYHVHEGTRPQPRVVTPGATFSHLAPAPSDATVLFDGKDLSKWQRGNNAGTPAHWPVVEGAMQSTRNSIRTKDKWADFQLHLEWAAPTNVSGNGQGRGNSGILINGMYEVQVLDSFNNPTYPDGQAGAMYGQQPPLVNAAKPPGEWQTYDLIFESPRWDAEGKLTKNAAVTLIHNGLVLHNRHEYFGATDGIGPIPHPGLGRYLAPHAPEVFIELQDHNNPVRFRNIWIRPIGEYDKLLPATRPD